MLWLLQGQWTATAMCIKWSSCGEVEADWATGWLISTLVITSSRGDWGRGGFSHLGGSDGWSTSWSSSEQEKLGGILRSSMWLNIGMYKGCAHLASHRKDHHQRNEIFAHRQQSHWRQMFLNNQPACLRIFNPMAKHPWNPVHGKSFEWNANWSHCAAEVDSTSFA